MTRAPVTDRPAALRPVREALLARARADAAAALAAADAEAARLLDTARDEAAAVLARAREDGERDAAQEAARRRSSARREARAVVLGAQRHAFDELHRRARAAVHAVREDPRYPDLLDRLRERAARELGPDARIRPFPGGGLVAEAPGRRLDLRLEALADEAFDALGPAVAGLWAAEDR